MFKTVSVKINIKRNLKTVWEKFTKEEHITKWYFASQDWHAPNATNDLRTGGKFLTRMEDKKGTMGFDFEGIYDEVIPFEKIVYHLADERKVFIFFKKLDDEETEILESFDAENENPIEMQETGWQSILNNFKEYVESQI